ncbi:hypothetical protein AVEN_166739-1, partial [Araneus ventricosus]
MLLPQEAKFNGMGAFGWGKPSSGSIDLSMTSVGYSPVTCCCCYHKRECSTDQCRLYKFKNLGTRPSETPFYQEVFLGQKSCISSKFQYANPFAKWQEETTTGGNWTNLNVPNEEPSPCKRTIPKDLKWSEMAN